MKGDGSQGSKEKSREAGPGPLQDLKRPLCPSWVSQHQRSERGEFGKAAGKGRGRIPLTAQDFTLCSQRSLCLTDRAQGGLLALVQAGHGAAAASPRGLSQTSSSNRSPDDMHSMQEAASPNRRFLNKP